MGHLSGPMKELMQWIKSEASKKNKLCAESWICWPNKTEQDSFLKKIQKIKDFFPRKGKVKQGHSKV